MEEKEVGGDGKGVEGGRGGRGEEVYDSTARSRVDTA